MCDLFQVRDHLVRLWMLEALQEVERQVRPEEALHHNVEHLLCRIVRRREGRVEHRGDAGVADEHQDEHVEDGLPLAVGVDDDLLFAGALLVLGLDVGGDLVLAGGPVLIVVAASGFKDLGRGTRAVEGLLLAPFELLVGARLDFALALLRPASLRSIGATTFVGQERVIEGPVLHV